MQCVADGLPFFAGRTLPGHRVLAGERHRRFEGNHGRSRYFDVFRVHRRLVYVAARPLRRRENAARADHQVHHHLHECDASRLTHADVDSGEGSAEVSLHSAEGSPEAVGAVFAEGSALLWNEIAYLKVVEQGCRVFALALRELETGADVSKLSREEVERDLRFVGFFAFECQTRADSALVIDALKTAGDMGTGDASLTGFHVANNSVFADLARPSELLRYRGDESPCWTVATGDRREKLAPPGTSADLAQSFNFAVTDDALEVSDCLDHVPNLRFVPARGQGQKQRTSRQRMSGRTSVVRRRPSATDPGKRDGPFAASAEGNARGHQGANPMEEAEPPKENVGPKRFSWLKFEPHLLPPL